MNASSSTGNLLAGTDFPYPELLAFVRGDISDPRVYARITELIHSDRRWRAHWDSVRTLDLERAAAVQDARDLRAFAESTPLCRAVAHSRGAVLLPLLQGQDRAADWHRGRWERHLRHCVYCRRMRRQLRARVQAEENGLPDGEPLLRDWLLEPLYAEALSALTRRLGRSPASPPTETVIAGHDTAIGETAVVPAAEPPALTAIFRTDPRRGLEIMTPVLPFLLKRVLDSEDVARQCVPALLAFLGREETLQRLRSALHVRDEVGGIVADFCREERLAEPEAVRAYLTRPVMDNILWQAAAVARRQTTTEADERTGLEAVERALREELRAKPEPEPAEWTVRVALHECRELAPGRRLEIQQRLAREVEALAS
jgi:hypothetical protein